MANFDPIPDEFFLTKEEKAIARSFIEKQKKEYPPQKWPPTVGGRWKFEFHQTSIGMFKTIRDTETDETADLTKNNDF